MADIPDTDNVAVAILSAALELSKTPPNSRDAIYYKSRLHRFLAAQKAIQAAVDAGFQGSASSIDVDALMKQAEQDIANA